MYVFLSNIIDRYSHSIVAVPAIILYLLHFFGFVFFGPADPTSDKGLSPVKALLRNPNTLSEAMSFESQCQF